LSHLLSALVKMFSIDYSCIYDLYLQLDSREKIAKRKVALQHPNKAAINCYRFQERVCSNDDELLHLLFFSPQEMRCGRTLKNNALEMRGIVDAKVNCRRFLSFNDYLKRVFVLFQDLRAVPSSRRDSNPRRDGVGYDWPLLFRSQDSRSLRTFPSKW